MTSPATTQIEHTVARRREPPQGGRDDERRHVQHQECDPTTTPAPDRRADVVTDRDALSEPAIAQWYHVPCSIPWTAPAWRIAARSSGSHVQRSKVLVCRGGSGWASGAPVATHCSSGRRPEDLAVLRAPRHSVASVLLVVAAGVLVAALVVLEHRLRRCGLGRWRSRSRSRRWPRCGRRHGRPTICGRTTCTAAWSRCTTGARTTTCPPSSVRPVRAPRQPTVDASGLGLRAALRRRAAFGAWVAGPSALSARLFFQACSRRSPSPMTLVVVWRTTRHLAALHLPRVQPGPGGHRRERRPQRRGSSGSSSWWRPARGATTSAYGRGADRRSRRSSS